MDEVPPSPVGSRGKLRMSMYNMLYLRASTYELDAYKDRGTPQPMKHTRAIHKKYSQLIDSKQIKEELQEVDKIIQEFIEGKNLHGNEDEHKSSNQEVNNLEENNRMNEVLMAVMSDHKDRVNQMGSLTEKDIP